MTAATINFPIDALPFAGDGKGDDMQITEHGRDTKTGRKIYLVDHAVRVPGSYATHIKRKCIGSTELALKIAEIKALSGGSLTSKTLAECIEHYEKHKGYGTKPDVFTAIKEAIGRHKVDRRFALVYTEYITRVAVNHAVNTVNNYRICIRSVLNFARKSGLIESHPIVDFGMQTIEERDRVWTADERTRLYNAMAEYKSHLYWSVRLAEKNPIRSGDLWDLRIENFVEVGEGRPCIRFFASKTRKKKNKPTFLIELDRDLIAQFDWQRKNIPDCPWLFPHIWHTRKEGWKWEKMGDPKRHWGYIRDKAQVEDFRFHDLRHVATTYMLEKRDAAGQRVYDEDDMRDLGLFYSKRVLEIYRNRKAERVIERVFCSTFVAPEEGKVVAFAGGNNG